MSEHTPGPWGISRNRDFAIVHNVPLGKEYKIRVAVSGENVDANARLIAAAPKMLASLERLAERCDRTALADGSSLDTLEAHAVIAEARGEPPTEAE